jgi:hypothetical protein
MDDIEKYTRADRINYRLGIITLDATPSVPATLGQNYGKSY